MRLCLNGPEGRVVGWGLRQGGALVGVKRLARDCVLPTCVVGRIWQTQMWSLAVSVHAAMTVTEMLSLILYLRSRKSLTSTRSLMSILYYEHTPRETVVFQNVSSATTSWGRISQFSSFGASSLGLVILCLWLSEEFFWHRIPPVGPPQGPKPLVLRACLSWSEEHKALHREIPRLNEIYPQGHFSHIWHKHTVLCQHSFPSYYHLKVNSTCNVSVSFFDFLLFPASFFTASFNSVSVSPFQTYFSFNFAVHRTD